MDTSLVVLSITAVSDEAATALKDPRNAEFLVPRGDIPESPSLDSRRRDGTPFIDSPSFITALRIDHYPFDPALGWVFGREGENVDFVLGGLEQGVSQKHFRIDRNWKAMVLVLTNLSGNSTRWIDPETGEAESLTGSRAIVGRRQYEIAAGTVWLTLQIPLRTQEQQARYNVLAEQLRVEIVQAAPTMLGLKVARLDEDPTSLVARRFVLGRVVGTGMTAAVHEPVDRETGDRFAGKKHIIDYVAFNGTPDPILIMEIALKSLEKCTIASTTECVDLLRQVLSGLAFLHDKNVMHRDIKPANILLTHETPGAEWKLGDFGLSKLTDNTGITGTFCGSPLYLAPEVDGLVGSVCTNAVDVWSAGVVGVQYSCGFGGRDLKKMNTTADHKAWVNPVARRAKSKASVLAEYLTPMLDVMPAGRPTAKGILERLQGWEDSEASGLGEGDHDGSKGKGKEKEENAAESLEDDCENSSEASTIRAAGDEDREENRENAFSEVTSPEAPVPVKRELRRSSRQRARWPPN